MEIPGRSAIKIINTQSMRTKDGHDVSIEQINAENYKVSAGEERLYHVKIEVRQYNQKTGKKISVPRVQKYGAKQWKTIQANSLRKMAYEVEVLHNPTEWIAKMNAQRAESKAAKARAEKEAMKEALKAELMAEIKAEMAAEKAAEKAKRDAEKARKEAEKAKKAEESAE